MKRAALVIVGLGALVACGGPGAQSPHAGKPTAPLLAQAYREEATGDPEKAAKGYFAALEEAAAAPDDPWAIPTAMAALDALVYRSVSAFADVSGASALSEREAWGAARTGSTSIEARLVALDASARGIVKPLVENAIVALAERRGDAKLAGSLRGKTCARTAVVAGPLAWAPVSGVKDAGALDRADAPLPADVGGPGPFTKTVKTEKVVAFGCHLPLYAATSVDGVREVVLDVAAPRAGSFVVALRSTSAATLKAGGALALERPYAAGGGAVARFARVTTSKAGWVRLVARVGMEQDYASIDLGAWDGATGEPLRSRAPSPGEHADAIVTRADVIALPTPKTDDEKLGVSLGALAAKDIRAAENVLDREIARTNTPPELLLVYARAIRLARDLPPVKAQERARAAYDRVLETWPSSWEAIVEHAVLAGSRRGRAEANIEMLADLDKTRTKKGTSSSLLLDAFEAATAGREGVFDRAKAAYERANHGELVKTPLLRDVERVAEERTGQEDASFACDPNAPSDKSSLACQRARISIGDRDGAERELERLRALADTPQLYLSLSTRSALEAGDIARAKTLNDKMNPGDRALATIYAVKGKSSAAELLALAPIARDAPSAIPGLLRATGDDPLHTYEGIAERVTSAPPDASAAGAATIVLAHDERYDIEASGLVRFTMLDVRRVMGTTDVESNAQAAAPMLYGRDTLRVLRRRIFKKDGRILLPDRTPNASQSHADLSQLEAGDAIEAIYEGWSLPGDMGNIGIDTPDLFPERTTVKDARIELKIPLGLRTSLWSHPVLGKAEEKNAGGKRVLVWKLENKPIRRLEPGVPKMDRSACVSFSTTTWNDVARGLRETIASIDADSPEVTAWAREVVQGISEPRKMVDALVVASGQAVKEASGIVLADVDLGHGSGQTVTARTTLATHEGSRTWLLVRALRELGIKTEVVVAENEPFSDSSTFPPHFGRFMHPLAVAQIGNDKVWIDADVPGPPLPAGRISPELRGRMALSESGTIAPLPSFQSDSERDEIDERLTVDEQGNAKGSLTVLLRGRAAQDLAEALVRLVGAERQRALRGIALAWVPFATVEKVELSSSEGSWQIAIRAELTAPAYAALEGSKGAARTWVLPGIDPIHYVFPRPYVSTLGSTYASHGARENALAINHAAQYHVRRRVDLPAKSQIAKLPGPFTGKGPLLRADRKIAVNGNTIEEDFTLDVTTGTIPRDKYDDFVGEAHRTDDAFRASTRVKPPGS